MDLEIKEALSQEPVLVVGDTRPTRASINSMLRRVDIKGKDYIDVAQRINGFWELFPEGSIVTKWLVLDGERCVCQATVSNMGVVLATGTAEERKGSSNINKTSYIENCETSAVGRALGLAGIGSTDSIASADEVKAAQAAQKGQDGQKYDKRKKASEGLGQAQQRCRNALKAYSELDYTFDPKAAWDEFKRREDYENTEGFWTARAVEYEMLL